MFVEDLEIALLVEDNHMCHACIGKMFLTLLLSTRVLDEPLFRIELDIVSSHRNIWRRHFNLKVRDLYRELGGVVHVLTLAAQQHQTPGFNSLRGGAKDKRLWRKAGLVLPNPLRCKDAPVFINKRLCLLPAQGTVCRI